MNFFLIYLYVTINLKGTRTFVFLHFVLFYVINEELNLKDR